MTATGADDATAHPAGASPSHAAVLRLLLGFGAVHPTLGSTRLAIRIATETVLPFTTAAARFLTIVLSKTAAAQHSDADALGQPAPAVVRRTAGRSCPTGAWRVPARWMLAGTHLFEDAD